MTRNEYNVRREIRNLSKEAMIVRPENVARQGFDHSQDLVSCHLRDLVANGSR